MSDLMVFNAVKMNSLEIAELTGSDHKDIKRSIYRLIKKGIIQNSPMAKVENKQSLSPNRFSDVYVFEGEQGKRDSIIVVAQNCPEFTARLVDRWQELENLVQQNAPAIPQTLSEALRLAADLAEEKERLALVNKELAPKAAVCDAIVKNDMHRTASEVAKPLGMSAVKLNRKLSAVGVYDLRCRRRVFSQWFIDEGYGEMRVTHDGYEQAVFTAKGQVWITELLTCN
ncbi:phage antirepressor KilAC domain-containing protein [Escherichia coli]|uniref:phage antirepressor KilAC domain-containing protein n=1 Tax=Escherichia coli TaxID=562 RepID=UPI001F13722E|nr:phage antirepressor KilAC domain-containing protein [Escherichia coli]MCH6215817.1 Rha family transcriptional regulator [Escherichia coli]MCH6485904.1 Rha family transcriptional regulator [Escherichia coli]